MKIQKMLKVTIQPQEKKYILDKIKKNISSGSEFMNIVSLNPENLVEAYTNKEFRKILSESPYQLIDGVGIKIGGFILGHRLPMRTAGSDFMNEILDAVKERELSVLLLGGKGNIAEQLAECYSKKYTNSMFFASPGFIDINKPKKEELDSFFNIITEVKPHIMFVAFGSPAQEQFIEEHKKMLKGVVCMGVGGSFDFASGRVRRAPVWVRKIGMEWFFRLLIQPWRVRRQLKLILFLLLILLEKIKSILKR